MLTVILSLNFGLEIEDTIRRPYPDNKIDDDNDATGGAIDVKFLEGGLGLESFPQAALLQLYIAMQGVSEGGASPEAVALDYTHCLATGSRILHSC